MANTPSESPGSPKNTAIILGIVAAVMLLLVVPCILAFVVAAGYAFLSGSPNPPPAPQRLLDK